MVDERPPDTNADAGGAEEAVWPAGQNPAPEQSIRIACAVCALHWRIHESLAGFRLRCRCGAWVDVPALHPGQSLLATQEHVAEECSNQAVAPRGAMLPMTATRTGHVPAALQTGKHVLETWDGRPLTPNVDGVWTLRHASVETRKRWTNRTLLELALMVGAFIVPSILVHTMATGSERVLWLPVADVGSGLLVLLFAQSQRWLAFSGLRAAHARYFLEALGMMILMVLLAQAWVAVLEASMPHTVDDDLSRLREQLGIPMALFVVSLTPGFFEELAFRGLIQGRLALLMGPVQGAIIGGVVFALAHGITLAFPIHVALGIYLSFLRLRCDSLLPGMLLHATYNAAILLFA